MTLGLVRTDDYDGVSRRAAEWVAAFLSESPGAVVALPTGRTPLGMYATLRAIAVETDLDVSGVRLMNLDEILGLDPNHEHSFHRMLRDALLDHAPFSACTRRLLDGATSDPQAECARHEAALRAWGGLDLAILGIGANGHIAFNEPGTGVASRTHVAALTTSTVEQLGLSGDVDQGERVTALTMGIGTILYAGAILLLASGRAKARVLDAAFHGPITQENPASALQRHPKVTIIADREALCLWSEGESR